MRRTLTQETIVFLTAIVLFVVFSLALDNFLSAGNMITLIRNVAVLGILSLGMAIVVIGRGVDLSLIAVMAVSLTVAIVVAASGRDFVSALLIGLAFVMVDGVVMGYRSPESSGSSAGAGPKPSRLFQAC